jgi:pSer/pThr/pTyr-binding forkhead associated (FHA) protein
MVPKLTLIMPDKTTQTFKLDSQKNIIGRNNTNTIFIDDDQISRKHAVIYFDQDNYWIEDLRSKNGVHVNGKKIIQPHRLRNGSLIKLGATMLRFELSNHPE